MVLARRVSAIITRCAKLNVFASLRATPAAPSRLLHAFFEDGLALLKYAIAPTHIAYDLTTRRDPHMSARLLVCMTLGVFATQLLATPLCRAANPLPKPILETLRQRFPSATVEGCGVEREQGVTYYEVQLDDHGKPS